MNVLVPINFNSLEALNFRFQNLATQPAGALEGRVFWNTATKQLEIYDGTQWVTGGGTGGYVLPTATTTVLGGVKAGTHVNVGADGVLKLEILDSNNLIKPEFLPSYVDDVLEFPNFAGLPSVGEQEKIYVTIDDNALYRWSGTVYIKISDPLDYATQSEAEAGTNNDKVMTPLRVKQAIAAQAGSGEETVKKYAVNIGDGSQTSYIVTHSLNTTDVTVACYVENALVLADVVISSANAITVTTATPLASNAMRVVVTG